MVMKRTLSGNSYVNCPTLYVYISLTLDKSDILIVCARAIGTDGSMHKPVLTNEWLMYVNRWPIEARAVTSSSRGFRADA